MHARPLLLMLVLVPVAASQTIIRPGLYELTIDMQIAGAPPEVPKAVFDAAGFQGQKKLQCITPEDVKGTLPELFARDMGEENCKVSDVKTAGTKTTFTLTCEEDGTRTVIRNDMTVTGESVTVEAKATDSNGLVTTMKISGKRIGECTK